MADDARNQVVSLGCGTLAVIAMIVLFFSNRAIDDVEREVRVLRTEIGAMREAVEAQTTEIKALREELRERPRGE